MVRVRVRVRVMVMVTPGPLLLGSAACCTPWRGLNAFPIAHHCCLATPNPNPQDVRISLNSGYDWSTGTQAAVQTFEYYRARPSALEPTGGHVRGGTLVTVRGNNLDRYGVKLIMVDEGCAPRRLISAMAHRRGFSSPTSASRCDAPYSRARARGCSQAGSNHGPPSPARSQTFDLQ